ncbi:MAG: amino terminal protease self-immunity [Verrucomicrobiaceae bacterium]|nr:amino terminal protease self-immunity [Verrucomicrobiaceae bacterium]
MTPSDFHLLRNLYLGCAGCMAVALLASPWLQRRAALAPDTEPDGGRLAFLDGWIVLLLVLVTGLGYIAEVPAAGAAQAAPPQAAIKTVHLLAGMMLQLQAGACLWFYLRLVRNLRPQDFFGLRKLGGPPVIRTSIVSLVLTYAGMQAAMWLVQALLMNGPMPRESDQQMVQALVHHPDASFQIAAFCAAGIVAPVAEELIYRGMIYGILRRKAGNAFAMVATSLIFALAHQSLQTFVPLFVFSLGLCIAYNRSRSLLVPMAMHAMFNGWNFAGIALSAHGLRD